MHCTSMENGSGRSKIPFSQGKKQLENVDVESLAQDDEYHFPFGTCLRCKQS